MTLDLFSESNVEEKVQINRVDLDVLHYPRFFGESESDIIVEALKSKIFWQQDHVSLYGKTHPLPRLTSWYGDEEKTYSYSGITVESRPWTPELLLIKGRIERESESAFNSVLLNLYRTGQDGVSWHSDDERELGVNPVIGSVSFGEKRMFHLRHKNTKETIKLELGHGDFLLMRGRTQHAWVHQVAKTAKKVGPRINLTYRSIR